MNVTRASRDDNFADSSQKGWFAGMA